MLGVVFWALILFGVPLIVNEFGLLFLLFGLSLIIGNRAKRLPASLREFMGGIIASLVAGLFGAMCRMTTLSLFVPIWLSVLSTVFLSLRREPRLILPADLGLAVGYLLWVWS